LGFETESNAAPSMGFFSTTNAVSYEDDPDPSWVVNSLVIRFPLRSYVALYELKTPDVWPEFIEVDLT
jgi:hypothetical protein